jgi:cysteine synthase
MNSRHPALDNLARRSIPGQKETTTPNHQRVYGSIVELIANPANPTPMVKLSESYNASPDFEMLLKLESFNPFGSIKDRTALYLLKGTQLAENQVLAEPTAGNTGIALAALANAQGTDIELAVPEATPEEKKTLLRLLGAELLEVEDELCPLFPTEGARGVVKSMVESAAFNGKYVSPNQYENELNVDAHYNTTGPEIWNQTGGDIDYFLAAFGTCGTITGVGRYLKERNPDIKIIGIEPSSRNHKLSGIKKISDLPKEFRPKILDYSLIDDIIGVDDRDAFEAGIQLARSEGIMVGPTTGAVLHAARQLSKTAAGRAVVISPDGAETADEIPAYHGASD